MGLSKLFERLYPKVFVGIATSYHGIQAVVEMHQNGKVSERRSHTFEGDDIAPVEAFVAPYLAESPFHYVALLNDRDDQGALPVCSRKDAQSFIDTTTAITLCQDNSWMLFAHKAGLDTLRKRFEPIGVDYIFSPFSILSRFFADKVAEEAALYVLLEEDAVSSAVFAEGNLVYARRLGMTRDEDQMSMDEPGGDAVSLSFELDADGIEEGLELDDINAIDDLDGLDELTEIEDLDAADDLEHFAEQEEAAEPEEVPEETSEDALKNFDKDYKRFQMIQTALQHFYAEPRYDNRFIESVYIADGVGLGNDLKTYLEEELFMKVYVRKIDIPAEVADLAKSEVTDAP
jgi:hypothetical protein